MAKKLSASVIKSLSGEIDPITGLTPTQSSVRKSRSDIQQYNQSLDGIEPLGDYFPTKSKYDEGMDYADVVEPNGVEKYRHEQQPFIESLGSTLAQAATEVVAGTIEGAGYLLDLPQVARTLVGEEKEFHNWLTELGSGLREGVKSALPIYEDPTKQGFSPGEWAWWANDVIPSLASTASIAIPVGGFMKGAGILGKLVGATEGFAKLPSVAQFGIKGISSAVVSRQLENMMEANSVNTELRQLEGTQVDEKQARQYMINYGVQLPSIKNPDGTFGYLIDKDAAKEIAAKGAANTYRANWAMVLQDIPQYLIGTTPFGRATNKLTSSVAKELGENYIPLVIKNVLKHTGNAIGEGLEEMYQYGAGQYSKEMAMSDAGLIKRRDLSTATKDYMNDGDMWTSFVAGTLGGAVMAGGQHIYNNVLSKKNGLETPDEARIKDIKSWSTKSKMYSDMLVSAGQGGNADAYNDIQNEFMNEFGLNMAKNGNLQYGIDFLNGVANATPEELKKYNVDEATANNIKENLPSIKQRFENIGKTFESNLNQLGDKYLASEATMSDVRMKDYNAKVDKLTNDAELILNTEFPNFSKLTPKGQENYRLYVELASTKSLLDLIKAMPIDSKDEDIVKSKERKVAKLEEIVADLHKRKEDLNYTEQDKAENSNIVLPKTANDAYVNIMFKRQKAQSDLDEQIEYSNNIHDPKWRESQEKKREAIQKDEIIDAVNNAKTPDDVADLKARAETSPNPVTTKVVKKQVDKTAAQQLDGNEGFQPAEPMPETPVDVDEEAKEGLISEDASSLLTQRAFEKTVDNNSEKDAKLKATIDNFFTDKRYKDNPVLFSKERDELGAILKDIADRSAGAEIDGVAISDVIEGILDGTESNPELYSERVKSLYVNHANGVSAATAVYKAIYDYYQKANKSVESASNDKALLHANTPQQDSTHISTQRTRNIDDISITRSNGGADLYIATGEQNGAASNRFSSSDAIASIISQDMIDSGAFSIGEEMSIEWDPRRSYGEKNPDIRSYQLTVYKDGKRHVVGFLPSTNKSGFDKLSLSSLRQDLQKYFNEDFTKNKTSPQKYPNRTLKIVGFKSSYSQSDKASPMDVLPEPVSGANPIYERRGGFLVGYMKEVDESTGRGIVHFPNQGVIPTISGVDSKSGDVFIGIPNPLKPDDVLIIHGFKRNLSDVYKNVDGGRELVDGIFANLFNQSNEFSFASVFANDKSKNHENSKKELNKTLVVNEHNWMRILQLASVDGALTIGTDENGALLNELMSYYMTFNDDSMNKDDYNVSSGLEARDAMYNQLMSPFIAITSEKNKPLNNTQILIPANVRDAKDIPVAKNIKKSVDASVKSVMLGDVLNGSQIEQMAEDAASAEAAKPIVIQEPIAAVEKPLPEKIVDEAPAITPEPAKRQRPPRLAPEDRVDISAAIVVDIKSVEDSDTQESSAMLRVANKPFKSANKASELAWMHSKFPNLSIKDIDEISDVVNEVTKGGHTAWGAFYNASVYLRDSFSEGTIYHEAFHAIFTLALSEKDKATLLAEAPSNLSDKDKNEYLADAFMDLIIADQMDKSLSAKIKRFFRKLAILVKSMWVSDVKNLRELADRSDMGFYRKSVSSDKFVDSSVVRLKEGYSFTRQKEAVESINNLLINGIIPAYRNSHPEMSILSDAEVLNFITKQKNEPTYVYRLVSDAIYDVVDNDTTLSDEQKDILEGLALDMFDGQYRPTKLVADCVRSLSYTNNIELNLRNADGIRTNFDEIVVDEDNADGGRAVGEVYGVNFTQVSSKFGASQRVKDAIRYTKTGEKNFFGLPKYVKYDDVYNVLLKDLSGSTSVGQVYNKLVSALPFHPEYKSLIDKMSDPLFSSDMLQAFSRVHMPYLVIYDDKYSGNTIITDANRNGVSTSIINRWANGVLTDSEVISRDGVDSAIKFNMERIIELDAKFRAIASVKNGFRSTEDFINMERITTAIGFPIPAKVFQYIESQNPSIQNKVYRGASSIKTIMDSFVSGKNPFDIEGATESKAVKYLANITKSAMPELFESSFVNSNGDKIYSQIVPTFFMKLVGKLHDPKQISGVVDDYIRDDMFGLPGDPSRRINDKIYNVILKNLNDVKDDEELLKEELQVGLISDYSYDGKTVTYDEMNAKDMASLTLKMYYNSANGTYSWFRMPVLSDSGNLLSFRVKRKNRVDAISSLVTLAGSEYRRIQSVSNGIGSDIKNYGAIDKNTGIPVNGNTNTGYSLMDMFNGFDGDPVKNSKLSEKLIDDYFTEYTNNYIDSLKNLGVIVLTKDGKIDPKLSSIEKRLVNEMNQPGVDIRTTIKDFLINDYLMRANMSLLTVGDPAFYKDGPEGRKVDYFKRAKEIFSPKSTPTIYNPGVIIDGVMIEPESGYFPVKDENGNVIDKIQVPAYYRSIYIDDNEIAAPSGQMFGEAIDLVKESDAISEQKAKELRVSYGITKNDKGRYETTNQTDAQAYITLPFYRITMISESKWTDKHQSAYDRLMSGKGTAKDIVLVMQPRKPFMYTQIFDKGIGRMVPVQHKNSEFLLLPQLVKNNPKLQKLMDYMIKEDVGIANFESAVKTGLSGSVKATDVIEVRDGVEYKTKIQNLDGLESATIHEIPMIDRGMQMEVTEHHISAKNNFGSQIRKIIMSDLMLGHDYIIENGGGRKPITKKAEELFDLYESIIVENLKDAYEDVKQEFTIDGAIDWKKIHDLLLREGISRGEGEEFERAIAYVGEHNRLALPLFHPVHSDRIQAILTSLFRNRVTKQKISGGAFVQLSSFGLANELKLVFDVNVDSYYEKLLKSGEIEFKDDDGNPCTI